VRLLLDTHALLWWYSDDPALPKSCRKTITQQDNGIFVSAASAWEIATKFRLGKLATASELIQDFGGYLNRERFMSLPVSQDHGIRAGTLPGPLQDPFDRRPRLKSYSSSVTKKSLTSTAYDESGDITEGCNPFTRPFSPLAANPHSLKGLH